MSNARIAPGSLVLYKIRPAIVRALGEKIEIALEGGQQKRVRPKDIQLLHPGPIEDLGSLLKADQPDTDQPDESRILETLELLEGAETGLQELAELLHDAFTPAAAWSTWTLLNDGLYFSGNPACIQPRALEEITAEREAREAKARAEQEQADFMARLKTEKILPEDHARLHEVERLAHQQSEQSRILKALNLPETPQSAQRLLTRLDCWPSHYNPHPRRQAALLSHPELAVPELADEPRLDLTHLPAFAIDDEGNQDPDDAISIDGECIWVHVADVAALVAPDSELDREARARGANLYLPEGVTNMLPPPVTERLGLGLQAESPALSFGFICTANGQLEDLQVHASRVRVTRLSYGAAEDQLNQGPLAQLRAAAERYRSRRQANGAISIDLPEVSVRLVDGEVRIQPFERLHSRALVMELMLMAGEAAARLCAAQGLPIPHASQPAPEGWSTPEVYDDSGLGSGTSLAAMVALRRCMKPSRTSIEPGHHFGLGLEIYSRATSPLRRYGDLLVHQQLRLALRGEPPLTAEEVSARSGEADQASLQLRRAERLSNQHWKLVHLHRNPDWRGEAVVVELGERKTKVLIPSLALEAQLRAKQALELDQRVELALAEVDLPDLDCRFRLV